MSTLKSMSAAHYPAHLTPRQKAREIAFQFLYSMDQLTTQSGVNDFQKHAQHFEVPAASVEYATRLVQQTLSSLEAIDAMITKHAENWRLDRIGTIEKAFLRMGIAELLYFKDVPASVTLNEMVELSKYFGESDTPAFLNGILDPVSREPQALAGKVLSE